MEILLLHSCDGAIAVLGHAGRQHGPHGTSGVCQSPHRRRGSSSGDSDRDGIFWDEVPGRKREDGEVKMLDTG